MLAPSQHLPEQPEQARQPFRDGSFWEEEWILPGKSTGVPVHEGLEVLDLSGKVLFPQPNKVQLIRKGKLRVWVYGHLRYFDGISPLETTSGFCYYVLCGEDGPEWLVRGGDSAYWLETKQESQNPN
jgi:hypothetical protein